VLVASAVRPNPHGGADADSDVPFWQVGLAVVLIVASIVGLTWLAGRMYTNAAMRIGPVRSWIVPRKARG